MEIGIFRFLVRVVVSSPFFLATFFLPAFSRTLVGKNPLPRILAMASSLEAASISSLTSWPEEFMASYAKVAIGLSQKSKPQHSTQCLRMGARGMGQKRMLHGNRSATAS